MSDEQKQKQKQQEEIRRQAEQAEQLRRQQAEQSERRRILNREGHQINASQSDPDEDDKITIRARTVQPPIKK